MQQEIRYRRHTDAQDARSSRLGADPWRASAFSISLPTTGCMLRARPAHRDDDLSPPGRLCSCGRSSVQGDKDERKWRRHGRARFRMCPDAQEERVPEGSRANGPPCCSVMTFSASRSTGRENTRTMQSNAFGMTGAGKTNLLETVTEQDITRGVPIIFIDGKGDKKLLAELLPSIEAAGRMQDLRIIDPMRPEISARYNPFWAPEGNAEEHVGFVFESFNMEKDFFEGHQRVYLENIARVLHYSGKRFNFHDVLVCAYDQALLKKQMKVALDRVAATPRSPASRG